MLLGRIDFSRWSNEDKVKSEFLKSKSTDRLHFVRSLSGCLVSLPQANGRVFATPSQIAATKTGEQISSVFAKNFASQCGYCTPGIVASIAACSTHGEREKELDGHICRCTGYRPIRDSIKEAPFIDIEDIGNLCATCPSRQNVKENKVALSNSRTWHSPSTLMDAIELIDCFQSNFKIISGNTAKHVEKYYKKSTTESVDIIDISRIDELNHISTEGNLVSVGAAVSMNDFIKHLKEVFPKSLFAKKVISALEFVGSVSVREQATFAGSLFLQKENPSFCSDIAVILSCLNAKIQVRHVKEEKSLSIQEFFDTSGFHFIKMIQVEIPNAVEGQAYKGHTLTFQQQFGTLSIGKVTSRPTMSAGYITYAFLSNPAMNKTSYFYNAGEGLKSIVGPDSLDKSGINACLGAISDNKLRGCLFKHFKEFIGEPIVPLDFNPIEYELDDSKQPANATNVQQQHAKHLASRTALYPSDTPPSANQLDVAVVKAAQMGKVVSIGFTKCKGDRCFIRGITATDIEDANFNNSFIQIDSNEADETNFEQILCSKSVLYINQPVAIVVAKTRFDAYRLRKLVNVEYSEWNENGKLKPSAVMEDAIANQDFFPNSAMAFFDKKEKG